jgi:hypothetical protein
MIDHPALLLYSCAEVNVHVREELMSVRGGQRHVRGYGRSIICAGYDLALELLVHASCA